MRRRRKPGERGAALLAVLLLVAVTGALAAAAIEKLRLSQALAFNMAALDQARLDAAGIETLVMLAIDDRIADSPGLTTLAGGWLGAARRVPLPDGGMMEGRLYDGGNCFNLNSLVAGEEGTYAARRSGVEQFFGLMAVLGVPQGEARRVAEAAADWADSDAVPGPGGAEDAAYAGGERPYRPANALFADVTELRAVAGVTPETYDRVSPFLCALPAAQLSPINVNTLLPDQAPLLAMLAPDRLSLERARRLLLARPSDGWQSALDFWRTEAMSELNVPLDVQMQPQVRSRWFRLEVAVEREGAELRHSTLIDSRLQPSRVASRTRLD